MGLFFRDKNTKFGTERGTILDIRSGKIRHRLIEQTTTKALANALTDTLTAAIPDGAHLVSAVTEFVTAISTTDRTTIKIGSAAAGIQYGTATLTAGVLAAGTKVGWKDGATTTTAGPVYPTGPQDIFFDLSGGATGTLLGCVVRFSALYWIAD